jgi:hypothetical protein
MHEFMEFYRMDYTSNIFVNESNYQGNTDRSAISKRQLFLDQKWLNLGNKLGLKNGEKSTDKPLLALIIGQLMNKTSSASGGNSANSIRPQAKENSDSLGA